MRLRLDEPPWWYGEGWSAAVAALAPLAALYGRVARARFARAKPYRSRLPVICVGNLTAGGTGKTPLTLYLCERLRADGFRPAVLTRGYGGTERGPRWVALGDSADAVGDEALLLARAAPTLVARDRAAGAQAIEGIAGGGSGTAAADVIVMDDGLQNPQLAKDVTLAVVDGRRGIGNGRVMPAGPLRAPLAFQLGLVEALIVNAPAAAGDAGLGDPVTQRLGRYFAGPILRSTTAVAGDAGWLKGQRVVAWAGIGAPQRFFGLLETLGAEMVERVAFGDHERLAEADARRLLALAGRRSAMLVTTAKDMARLTGAVGALAELAAATRVLPIALTIAEPDAGRLAELIAGAIARRREAATPGRSRSSPT